MNILIVKFGALGDVVRTSYFPKEISAKYPDGVNIYWITSPAARDLLVYNPYITVLVDFEDLHKIKFDIIYSLDDEKEIVLEVSKLSAAKVVGAHYDPAMATVTYSTDSAEWFDMGLISKYGKEIADCKKRENRKTHAEIFSKIFTTKMPTPQFYYPTYYNPQTIQESSAVRIGINPFAGKRWISKELPANSLTDLITFLLEKMDGDNNKNQIVLLGAGEDHERNLQISRIFGSERIVVPDTTQSLIEFAHQIRSLTFLVTTDSLAMHLAIAQKIPFLAFFAPTSAHEIDDFGCGRKLLSESDDYCSYRPDADNSSISFERIKALIEVEPFMLKLEGYSCGR